MSDEHIPRDGGRRGGPPEYVLLSVGVILLLVPVLLVPRHPDLYDTLAFHFRVITALGGGLAGASLPGILQVNLPFARGGGALGVFLLLFAVNPPGMVDATVDRTSTSLDEAARRWVDVATDARKKGTIHSASPLPATIATARAKFEEAWSQAGLGDRTRLDDRLAFDALSLTAKVYRIQETTSEAKTSSFFWADQTIKHLEERQERELLVEALLDKAAIYLELSQIEHTEPDSWQDLAQAGDSVAARAYTLANAQQKPGALRIWSRFYYNLARPLSGDLSEPWDNDFLMVSLAKMREAFEMQPDHLNNATQLARITQRVAANPPQDINPAWTDTLRVVQRLMLDSWDRHDDQTLSPRKRIPPLNIIGVMTLDLVRRAWDEASADVRANLSVHALRELGESALAAQREAVTLVQRTEWEEDYGFDLYFDLARIHAVRCRIETEDSGAIVVSACDEAITALSEARKRASALQLQAAIHRLNEDPSMARAPVSLRNAMRSILGGEDRSTD